MKIVYTHDGLMKSSSRLSRYYFEIVSRMVGKVDGLHVCKLFATNNYFKQLIKCLPLPFEPNTYHKRKIIEKLEHFNTYLNLRFRQYDLVHVTDDKSDALRWTRKPLVISIHDVVAEKYNISDERVKRAPRHELINLAAHIICISETTRADLLKVYNRVNPRNVSVIYPGSNEFNGSYENIYNFDYLLYVGSRRHAHKNFDGLLRAIAPILNNSKLKLICTGSSFTDDELTIIKNLDIYHSIVNVGYISDDALASLYHFAKLFICPSKYEGFADQILEAYANECPVCLSDIPAFHEIAGDAAAFFDSESEDAIRNCVQYILRTPNYAAELINRGNERKKLFSWDIAAQKTFEIYNRIVPARKRKSRY